MRTVADAIAALSKLDPNMPLAVSSCGHRLAVPMHRDSHGELRLAVVTLYGQFDVAMFVFGNAERDVNQDGARLQHWADSPPT